MGDSTIDRQSRLRWVARCGSVLVLVPILGGLLGLAVPAPAADLTTLETASLPRGGDRTLESRTIEPAMPSVLGAADAALYREIFRLQKDGKWRAADRRIAKLSNRILMGHVLYQRYMHPTAYRSKYVELKKWMAEYADHPGAKAIYRLALRRQPKGWRAPRRPVGAPVEATRSRAQGTKAAKIRKTGPRMSRARRVKIRRLSNRIKSLVRRERPTQALKRLESKSWRRVMDALSMDRSRAVIARGYYHAGKDAKALAVGEQATKRSGAAVPYAHWWAGLAAWRLGKYARAGAHFTAMANAPEVTDWPRAAAAFWASRAWLVGREPARVNAMLRIAARYPRTFYGLLATQALGEAAPFDWTLPRLGATEIALLDRIPATRRALALIEVGETVRAESELKRLTGSPSPELTRVLLALIGKANLPDVAIRLGFRLQRARGERYDAALYPVPGWTPGNGYKIDRALVFAFIRQESRFKSNAKSRRGASGVMQLMPATARFVAGRGSRRGLRRALFDPERNIALGQKYIGMLLDNAAVGGNLFYAAAAYNAGPGTLAKWQRKVDYRSDPLLFIESIRSRETRDFVERVLTNFWIYRLRLGQTAPSLEAVTAGEWPVYIPLDTASLKPGSLKPGGPKPAGAGKASRAD